MNSFPKCPLIILIQDSEYAINEMQEEGIPKIEAERIVDLSNTLSCGLQELSCNSKSITVDKSNHCINETRPDAIINAIKELMTIEVHV